MTKYRFGNPTAGGKGFSPCVSKYSRTAEHKSTTADDYDRTEDDQISELQFLFGKYEEAIQKIEDLEYDIKDTRLAIKMTIDKCLGENHEFKPTSKVTKQDLCNALHEISVLINE